MFVFPLSEVCALEERLWTHTEKLAVIDSLTPAMLDAFSTQLLSTGEMDLFVHGNVEESEARAIEAQIRDALQLKPLFPSQVPLNRVVQLSPNESVLCQRVGLNPADNNSAALLLYQLGESTVELHAIAELFSHLIKQPLYEQLRTKEQLGYLVWSNLVSIKGVLHFRVLLQSSSASGPYLGHRVEAFLRQYRDEILPKMIAEESNFFQQNVTAVIAKKTEKEKTLTAESSRHWNEITLRRFQFDRVEREVAVLQGLDVNALLAFIDRFISMRPAEGESHRAKLAVLYSASRHSLPDSAPYDSESSVAFANVPLPVTSDSATVGEGPGAPSAASPDEEVVVESAPPKETNGISKVPVDHRPIRRIEEIATFKRTMPLFPSFQ